MQRTAIISIEKSSTAKFSPSPIQLEKDGRKEKTRKNRATETEKISLSQYPSPGRPSMNNQRKPKNNTRASPQSDKYPLFHVPPYELVHPLEFGIYAVLGIAGGFLSVAFTKLLLGIESASYSCLKRLVGGTRWWAV